MKKNAFGLKMPKAIFKDKDRDGFPNPVDCQPGNPNKQGRVGDWLKEKGQQYKEYKAKAPERRQAKLTKLREELEIEKTRTAMAGERTKRMGMRQRAMPPGAFGMSAGPPARQEPLGPPPSLMQPFPGAGFGPTPTKKRVKKMKAKRRKATKRKAAGKTIKIQLG